MCRNKGLGIDVMKFGAPWCQPCTRMKPVWEAVVKSTKDVSFVVIDVDADPGTAAQYKILSIPTIVFLKDGMEVNRIVGLAKEQEIRDAIDVLRQGWI